MHVEVQVNCTIFVYFHLYIQEITFAAGDIVKKQICMQENPNQKLYNFFNVQIILYQYILDNFIENFHKFPGLPGCDFLGSPMNFGSQILGNLETNVHIVDEDQ